MIQTGAVERRGKYHRVFYEHKCECGHVQWWQSNQLDRVPRACTHKQDKPEARGKVFFVMMDGRELPMWAVGAATDMDPWQKSARAHFGRGDATQSMTWDPPVGVTGFATREEAVQWKLDRTKWLVSRGRPVSKYQVVSR